MHATEDAHSIREDIRELREAVATVERLQREANGRHGQDCARPWRPSKGSSVFEGRVFD
jgi:hypothetical protein